MKSKIRILIVDDHQATLENVNLMLEMDPAIEVVAYASTGIQALDLARQHKPDVLLTDINMPGIDGLSVAQDVLRLLPKTKVIVMSVEDVMENQLGSILVGVNAFLVKPFSRKKLCATIHKIVSQNS